MVRSCVVSVTSIPVPPIRELNSKSEPLFASQTPTPVPTFDAVFSCAPVSIPSSLLPSVATSRPSTVPLTMMFPVTSRLELVVFTVPVPFPSNVKSMSALSPDAVTDGELPAAAFVIVISFTALPVSVNLNNSSVPSPKEFPFTSNCPPSCGVVSSTTFKRYLQSSGRSSADIISSTNPF